MPRKSSKRSLLNSQKPPLLFLEQPLDGARHQNVPQVRGAINPKSFVAEDRRLNTTAHTSWVNPQFDQSQLSSHSLRRGRRKKCPSTTSIPDRSSQVSRKVSVCKFPSLVFDKRSQLHPLKPSCLNKSKESASIAGSDEQQGLCQVKRLVYHSKPYVDTETLKQLPPLLGKNKSEGTRLTRQSTEGRAATSMSLEVLRAHSARLSAEPKIAVSSALTPVEPCTPKTRPVFTPPEVNTPELQQEGNSCPSTPFSQLLFPLSNPLTPSDTKTTDILVADTPERDYGVRVTWRKRKSLMILLKDRGHLL